jgi:RNA polymerase sigma factor (sigma-70 family)
MRCDSPVTELRDNAAHGVESAWQEIIRRYSPLVSSVCRRYGVVGADADDVGGTVWLRLVVNLVRIREPEALPGWLSTTVRHECLTLLRNRHREIPNDQQIIDRVEPAADESLLTRERRAVVRHAVTLLPRRDQELLSMLFSDPPMSYADISRRLGIAVGAIGPTRQRCLARLRRIDAIEALLGDDRHCLSN